MSLNGLDDPKVAEAHDAAVAEAGGWFLLKYASRDEVDIFGQGTGGVSDMRAKMTEYDENSPLYGFLRYRRRNVLVKYLPEGCSRLIQARVAVHFNAVCDRFSPYDSQLDIALPDDLRDSKLSTACSLHTASASASSSSSSGSLRRKHLMEIAEEDEDDPDQQDADAHQPAKRQSLLRDNDNGPDAAATDGQTTPTKPKATTVDDNPVKLDAALASSPEHSNFAAPNTAEVPSFVGAGPHHNGDGDDDDDTATIDASRRLSSQSSRPEVFSSYSSYSSYSFGKPKVKLGPRPSLDSANTRPQTAGNFRPVSSIPAGFKLLGKGASGSKKSTSSSASTRSARDRKDSTGSSTSTVLPDTAHTDIGGSGSSSTFPTTAPNHHHNLGNNTNNASAAIDNHHAANAAFLVAPRPATSSGVSTKSSASRHAMTPEKARLKKAMQMREKRKKAAAEKGTTTVPPVPGIPSTDAEEANAAAPITTATPEIKDAEETTPEVASEALTEEAPKAPETQDTQTQDTTTQPPHDTSPMAKSDSGVAIDAKETDAASETPSQSQSDSVPGSPVIDQQSTNASSVISEATTTAEDKTGSNDTTPRDSAAVELATAAEADPATTTTSATAEQEPVTTGSTAQQESTAKADPVADPVKTDGQAETMAETRETPAAETAVVEQQQQQQQPTDKPQPRKHVDPIRTDLASRPTSMNFSDSESLLEELQSATVQEAKPMLMAKTPRTPSFPVPDEGNAFSSSSPARPVSNGRPYAVRTVSNPVRSNSSHGNDPSPARSVSQGGAAYLNQVTQQRGGGADGLAKKGNMMGSSISQRIKALEKLSANSGETSGSTLAPSPGPHSRPSSTFFSVKKDRVPSRSPSVADRASSLSGEQQRAGRPLTAQSGDHLSNGTLRPARDRSSSISSRLSMFEPNGSPVGTPRGRPETVSVTARILRDSPSQSRDSPPSGDQHNDFKQSPLLVDHQRASTAISHVAAAQQQQPQQPSPPQQEPPSKEELHSRRQSTSFSLVRDFIKEGRKSMSINPGSSPSTDNLAATGAAPSPALSSERSGSSFTRRLSIGGSSRRSLSKDRDASDDETRSNSDKRKSRATRFMHRLSSLSGGSRGKVSSPPGSGTPTTVREETAASLLPAIDPTPSASTNKPLPPAPPAAAAAGGDASIVSALGDVNVQFPDTLLWKRRDMCIDSAGFVVFSSAPAGRPQSQHHTAAGAGAAQRARRFHLADFRAPCIPDVELQELPNSVVLELLGGSAVQVACEDRAGQTAVLKVLRDAHSAYAGQ